MKFIKRFLLSTAAAIGVAVILPASSFAAASMTDITGTIYNNGKPVPNAKVTVICDSTHNSRRDTADGNGSYFVQFPAAQCPTGAHFTVYATSSRKGGSNGGTVKAVTTKLNVNVVNVSLPEFGLIAGVSATLIGAGAILAIRRRQLSGYQA